MQTSKMSFLQAFIVSLLWHILCFFTFNIIVVPHGVTAQTFANVCFLGSILDNNAFTREIKRAYGFSEGELEAKPSGQELFGQKAVFSNRIKRPQIDRDDLLMSKQDYSSIDQVMKVDKYVFDRSPVLEKPQHSVDDVKIIGSAKGRVIISKPAKPRILEEDFILKHGLDNRDFRVRLKVTISPEGKVCKVEKLTSSGYPEIDLIWMRYVEKWMFAPLDPSLSSQDQQGILELELKSFN
ncbi:MAG: hypothetical protein ABIB11_03405 [Candidatus Omnitrophota bacterium]